MSNRKSRKLGTSSNPVGVGVQRRPDDASMSCDINGSTHQSPLK